MRTDILKVFVFTFFIFSAFNLAAQGPDCVEALTICSDGQISFTPDGPGINDFASGNNNADCLLSNENQSAWYYFEFQPDMPPNSVIEFTINPNGGAGEDYDFAIYGPNVDCDNLGFPVRCSYASSACGYCPATGLGNGAGDTSEPASGDGFVSGLTVQPGQGFYLVVDNWLGSSTGFSMDWGGSAAPFLNCDATPGCELTLEIGPDVTQCVDTGPFDLSSIVTGNIDPVTYTWTGSGDGTAYLSDASSPNPTVTLPPSFEGSITYTLVVEEPGCQASAAMTFTTLPSPVISGDAVQFCFGETAVIGVPSGFQSYLWSTGATTPEIVVDATGTYSVTVTNNLGCTGETSFDVLEYDELDATIAGESTICPGGSATFGLVSTFANYTWSNGGFMQTITVYAPGLYAVTVAELNGCMAEMFWEVVYVPFPPVSIDGSDVICEQSTADLVVDPGYAGYYWENGEEGQILEITAAGTYEVTIVDDDGCVGVQSITVDAAPTPNPLLLGDTIFCAGDSVVLSMETSYAEYNWSDGSTIDTLLISQGGEYFVTVTSDNGCSASDTIAIIEDAPVVTINGAETFCEGTSVNLQADSFFVAYSWSDGSISQNILVDTSGIFNVSVVNENGCAASDTFEVVMNLNPEVNILGNLAICPSGATILSTDNLFAEYLWSVDSTSQSITVNTPGVYDVIVTDINGCVDSNMVEVIEESQLTIAVSGDLEICDESTTVLGLDGSYTTYSWSTGEDTPTIQTGTAGAVSVSVTDEFGCFGETTVNVLVNPLPNVEITGDETFCEGFTTTLDAGDYNIYSWQDSSMLQEFVASATGTYSVTVTDSNGCINEASFYVEELALPVPQILGNLEFCPETNTLLMGEDGYVSYNWGNGQMQQSFSVDTAGTYTLTVIDSGGCEGSNSVTLTNFSIENPEISGAFNFCPGENTLLNVEQVFDLYEWSSGDMTQNVQVDNPGNYSVTVTDFNGCITSSDVDVSLFPVTDPQIFGPPGLCIGEMTQLQAETGYLTYQWNTGDDTDYVDVNNAGSFTVSVTDNNGCETSSTFQLPEFLLPGIDIVGSTTFCTGSTTTLSSSDTYSAYEWSTGSTSSSVQVGVEGNYELTVTDDNGCVNVATVDVNEATELSPVISGDLFYCETFSTILNAGSGFETYLWSDNSSGQTLVVDAPGIYNVSVTDAGGCSGEAEVLVVENPLPQPSVSGILEYCVGSSTLLDAGSGYNEYLWSTGEIQQQINVNMPGDYLVTVTNQFGCQQFDAVQVLERPLPEFSIIGQDFFCEASTTNIGVNGVFQSYEWSGGQQSQSVEINSPGVIGVTVINEFNCQQYEEIEIDEIPLPVANAGQALFLDCEVRLIALSGGINNGLGYNYVYSWSGPGITTENSDEQNPEVDLAGLYTLLVTDEDHGCQSNPSEVSLTDLAYEPGLYLEVLDTLDCVTDVVRIDAHVSVSGSGILYQWFDENMTPIPGATGDFYMAAASGEYFFEVIDNNTHCMAEDNAVVAENDLYPIADAGPSYHLDCINTTYTLDGTNSQQAYYITYQWQTSEGNIISNSNNLTPLINAPGLYQLIVTDTINGCENVDEVLVTQDIEPPAVEAGDSQQLDCHNETVTLAGSSTTQGVPIAFEWTLSGGSGQILSDENMLTINQAGTYSLLVTNLVNGCENNDEVTVNLDDSYPTALYLDFKNPTCFGDKDGVLFVESVTGGASPLLFSINGAPFSSFSVFQNLTAGEYNVVVQDVNGCEYEESLFLSDGNDLLLDLGEDIFINLGETAEVNAYVNLDPEELANITWQTSDSINCIDLNCLSFDARPFLTQQYTITITDENGCIRSESITVFVNKPRDVFIPNVFSPNGDGNNDVLMIFAGKAVTHIQSFLIFNRWGETVFEIYGFPPNDPAFGWDGRHRGKLSNSAVFTYFAEIEFIDGEIILFKGDITLIR